VPKYRRPKSVWSPLGEHQVWNAHKAGRRRGATQATLAIGGTVLAYKGAQVARKQYRKRRKTRRDSKGRFR
jgi:hypothetical protein